MSDEVEVDLQEQKLQETRKRDERKRKAREEAERLRVANANAVRRATAAESARATARVKAGERAAAHRALPQHRGAASGGSLSVGMAKSPKHGGLMPGEGPKHWDARTTCRATKKALMGEATPALVKAIEAVSATKEKVSKVMEVEVARAKAEAELETAREGYRVALERVDACRARLAVAEQERKVTPFSA
jgi:hypothetical protein